MDTDPSKARRPFSTDRRIILVKFRTVNGEIPLLSHYLPAEIRIDACAWNVGGESFWQRGSKLASRDLMELKSPELERVRWRMHTRGNRLDYIECSEPRQKTTLLLFYRRVPGFCRRRIKRIASTRWHWKYGPTLDRMITG